MIQCALASLMGNSHEFHNMSLFLWQWGVNCAVLPEDLSNALAELMPFSVSSSKFYVWAPETDRDDGMVKAQELYSNMLDDKQNN